MLSGSRVAIIGLDSVPPQLVFERFADDMPTLKALRARGAWGPLRSVVPPITVPAWSCMMSGRTPGELGIYGFRNRVDHSYKKLHVASSVDIHVPRLWDLVGVAGGDSILLGVPGTYPPPPVRGCVIGDFLAHSTSSDFIRPLELREEVHKVCGDYILDVDNFRSHEKERIAQQLFDMTEQRFALARHLTTTRPWDFFAMVDMAPDRMHHGFWRHCDPTLAQYVMGQFADLFRDYYRALDRHLERLLETFDQRTFVVVASDHGAQPMTGGFCINEWLITEGMLVLSEPITRRTPPSLAHVDWSRTVAWGDGGYYGRVFLNVAGREPNGLVPPSQYEAVRSQIVEMLEALVDHEGNPMGNRALRPEEIYPEVNGVAPDLIVYFGDLEWRSVGTLGLNDGLYTFENDTGPDDANHSEFGIVNLVADGLAGGRREGLSILDIAPTLQALLGIPAPRGQRGKVIE